MKKVLVFFCIIFIAVGVSGESFDNYKEEYSKENFYDKEVQKYEEYKEKLYKEFQIYKNTLMNEYKKYKDEITEYWQTAETSTRKKWIEYSYDKKTKRVVDFETGEIRIEVILSNKPDSSKIKDILRQNLEYMLNEDKRTAFKNDQVSYNTEKKLKDELVTAKSAEIEEDKILTPIYFNNKPDKNKIKKKARELVDKGGIGVEKSPVSKAKIISFKAQLPENSLRKKAKIFKPVVTKYSDKYRLRSDLIFSIIHNESSFNPMAKSYVPAYGLMQIVPKSAGIDATRFLFGKPKLLMPSYLYNAENNVEIGTVYFRILYYNYLKEIKNPTSRLYCAIASYNTGSGNMAKAFTGNGNISNAAIIINRMDPEDVYRTLMRNLPYEETRKYIKRVAEKIPYYNSF